MSFCKDCISGARHEGTPGGTYEEINGIRTYVATPTTDHPKDKAILYVTDVFGLKLQNNLLLPDDFARNGFKVYVPELFKDDPVPEDAFNPGSGLSGFNLQEWFPKHPPGDTGKRVRKVIDGLKEKGVVIYGATGYCYGARLVFDLAFDNVIHAAVISHPSLLNPKDLDTYIAKSKAPLLINSCEFDDRFPLSFAITADEKFANFAPGYRRAHFDGVHHGFAVRGDLNNPTVRTAKEGAFKNSVEWFIKHMQ